MATLREGLRLSLPTALQTTLRSLGMLSLTSILNSFGSGAVAAITSAYRVDSIAMLPVINLGSGVSTFTAQNLGAQNPARARKGFKVGTMASLITAMAIIAVVVPLGGPVIRLFGVSDGVVDMGRTFLRTMAAFYPLFAVEAALVGYLQGRGDVIFTGAMSLASLAARIAVSYAARDAWGWRVVAWSEVLSWAFIVAALALRVVWVRKKEKLSERP
jgi:Na+-driven multidrug efflux pump